MSRSQAKPVPLRAAEPVGELKAVHLQQVEEGVAHHVRDAVSGLQQAAAEPAHSQDQSCDLAEGRRAQVMPSGSYFLSQSQ